MCDDPPLEDTSTMTRSGKPTLPLIIGLGWGVDHHDLIKTLGLFNVLNLSAVVHVVL